jgi:hypothetical protein
MGNLEDDRAEQISLDDAYDAMVEFVRRYRLRDGEQSEGLRNLLSMIQRPNQGEPADQAMLVDFRDALDHVRKWRDF